LEQKYDTTENWVVLNHPPSNRIDIVRVACHEIGHVIGIPHIGAGNLMAPHYSQQIRDPQAGDISEAVSRYGRPLPTPEPEPTPDPTPEPGPTPTPDPDNG
ncbi:MAG: matrixin family metalloprotease, partial [Candidatus Dadabacteria bacterium]|nr:matrixin family metalloprotease [Candidatus Dadabacteria bacterium]